ncbi:unnamed protein product [Pleuronectes platessa]|uniref:Uncharacterized protein n=1 Tax=Pleuronectes platessa TaxID=8262 RepID=A0A9N7ZBX5_PLEPL|nr:unnamed protein product [Pleuronectes platessa]
MSCGHKVKRIANQPSLTDNRLRCCCHVPHSRPKQTKNPAQRPFGRFLSSDPRHVQCLSSKALRASPPQCVHAFPAFIQQQPSHPLPGLAVLAVRFIHKCLPHD